MKKTLLLLLLLSLLAVNLAYAYPPDNAAVLYYKQMQIFEKPDDVLWEQVRNLPTSTEPASQEVKTFIEKYKKNFLIPELEIASELKSCDWGLDFSQGFVMQMPGLQQMKNFTCLLLADGAIAAGQGDISTAIEKNLVVHRMSHHLSNNPTISLLVAWSMTRKSNEALRHILATHKINETELVGLKRELLLDSYQPMSVRESLIGERNVAVLEIPNMTAEKFKEYLCDVSEQDMKRSRQIFEKGDPAFADFADRSIKYIGQFYDAILSLLDRPYTQAFNGFEKENQKISDDANNGIDAAFLPAIFVPALAKCYNYTIRWKTEYNAMLNALDVYIIFQKTGKLPEMLTENSYPDCFSGKPFEYLVTKEGFTLRCRQEDLVDKKVQEYTFKLPK